MMPSCRPSWRNCAAEADPEIIEIDAMEDAIAPIDPGALVVRGLISTLELCHHKAERWVENILSAIAAGRTDRGLGTRPPGPQHPAEEAWAAACAALSAWCDVGAASDLTSGLGERTALKAWQVQRVIGRIRSLIGFGRGDESPYAFLLLGGEGGKLYRRDCPEPYRDCEAHWHATVSTFIHDQVDGRPAMLSLALAIDMLWPCHWDFAGNLRLVLGAIGGQLHPARPFAACGRNIATLPLRPRIERIARTLRAFRAGSADAGADPRVLQLLGDPTPAKRWLAACLDKTIRLQLDPPPALAAISALSAP